MTLKSGVWVGDLTPQALLAMFIADQVYAEEKETLVITSVNDSKHMANSKHYTGNAFDCRTTTGGISQAKAQLIVMTLRDRLGPNYDVVLEADHAHVEYDPKRPPAPRTVL